MTVGGLVRGDSTVGTVSTSATRDGSLADGVVNNASVDVESLALSVGSEILEEFADSEEGLLGPSSESVLEFLSLGVSANTTSVNSEWNDRSVLETSVHVVDSFIELQSLACVGNIVSVLVVSSQIRNSAFGGFGGFCGLSGVLAHWKSIPIY